MKVNIDIINIPGSVANWKFALQVPPGDLPTLREEQKSIAKDFWISEKDYARSVLARRYSEGRYRRYAEHFGQLLIKAARSHDVQSAEVTYDGWDDKFHCRLRRRGTEVPIIFDADIITVPLERGDRGGLLQAERAVKRAVEWAFWEAPNKKRKGTSAKKRQ